jgi:hypothetical protein
MSIMPSTFWTEKSNQKHASPSQAKPSRADKGTACLPRPSSSQPARLTPLALLHFLPVMQIYSDARKLSISDRTCALTRVPTSAPLPQSKSLRPKAIPSHPKTTKTSQCVCPNPTPPDFLTNLKVQTHVSPYKPPD